MKIIKSDTKEWDNLTIEEQMEQIDYKLVLLAKKDIKGFKTWGLQRILDCSIRFEEYEISAIIKNEMLKRNGKRKKR